MILNSKPLSLAEVKEYAKHADEKSQIHLYLKAFCSLSFEKASELSEKIRSLNNMKIKEQHIAKILDFIPKDSEEVNKIFLDVSLSEEEINSILSITKEY